MCPNSQSNEETLPVKGDSINKDYLLTLQNKPPIAKEDVVE